MSGHVILSHGLESAPDAAKITAIAGAATRLGWSEERPDYRAFDADLAKSPRGDVAGRIAHLREVAGRRAGRLVLAGSSMGAFTSARASLEVPVVGLFLLSPPVWLHGYDMSLQCAPVPTRVIHGWRDELIPATWVAAWAQARDVRCTFLPDTHRLPDHLDFLCEEFGRFLQSLQG